MDRAALITDNLKLVHKLANRYLPRIKDNAVDYDDIFSEGCYGLIKAAETFDPSYGYKFSTYASRTIWGILLRAFGRKGSISVPQHIIEVSRLIFREGLLDNSAEEIADRLGCSLNWAEWALHYIKIRTVSMDYQLNDGDGEGFENFVPHEEDYSTAFVQEFIASLKPHHRQVVELVLAGKDFRTIGDKVGITFQGVSNRMKHVKRYMTEYQAAVYGEA